MLLARHSLFAANPLNLEILGAMLALVGLVLLGALAVFLAGRWRKQPPLPMLRPEEELSRYRTLYDQGVMTKEEFDRIRVQLEKKASKAPAVSAETAAPPEVPQSPPSQAPPP